MKAKYTVALLFAALLFLASCGSPLPEDRKGYAGEWSSHTVNLRIGTDGMVNYVHQEGGTKTTINAYIQKFDGNNFEVGALGINTTFVVSKAAHQEDGVWKMTVDGRELTRYEE